MNDSWMSVLNTINYYGDNDGHFAELAGPGYFNDPDTVGILRLAISAELTLRSVILSLTTVSVFFCLNKGVSNFPILLQVIN